MNSERQVNALSACSALKITERQMRKKMMTIFFSIATLVCFPMCTSVHTHAGAHLEVEAKRLTLKVGLLISRISGRSKRTIKGGVCGSEGSLASQHMDMAMKKRAAEGVSLRSTAVLTPGYMRADWLSGERKDTPTKIYTQTPN